MHVKAVHLEAVTDLSIHPKIHSQKKSPICHPNGTNFVGANNKFRQLYNIFFLNQQDKA